MSQNLPNASIPEKLPPFVFAQWRGEPRSLNAAPGRPSVGTPIRGDPEGLHRPELIGKWAETSTTEGAGTLKREGAGSAPPDYGQSGGSVRRLDLRTLPDRNKSGTEITGLARLTKPH